MASARRDESEKRIMVLPPFPQNALELLALTGDQPFFFAQARAIDVYLKHNDYVRRHAPVELPLVFEASAGWAPLCAFPGCAVPDEHLPHVNSTEEFKARRA
jgi:hypothetical protein